MKLSLSHRHYYEIPDRYHNTFYLANASLFQMVNYYASTAIKMMFPEMVKTISEFKNINEEKSVADAMDIITKLEYCDYFADVRFPVRRRFGHIEMVRGMRACHGLSFCDTSFGGFRICENLSRHMVQGLAVLATYRNACFGFNLAGAHGGLQLNADLFDTLERKRIIQSYLHRIEGNLNITDIIEPDLFSTPEDMRYMKECQSTVSNVVVLGSSDSEMTTSPFYKMAGAVAQMHLLKKFMQNEKLMSEIEIDGSSVKGKTFILFVTTGLGNTGKEIARALVKTGAVCIGIREYECTLYEPTGINIKALFKHINKFGSMRNFSTRVKETDSENIFMEPTDILILAAVEKPLRCHIADKMQAKIIVEACNGPNYPTVDKILNSKRRLIIPSILAGGLHSLASYLEYINNKNEIRTEEQITNEINDIINTAVKEIFQINQEYNLELDFRRASYIKALRKIFNSLMKAEIKYERDDDIPIAQ